MTIKQRIYIVTQFRNLHSLFLSILLQIVEVLSEKLVQKAKRWRGL